VSEEAVDSSRDSLAHQAIAEIVLGFVQPDDCVRLDPLKIRKRCLGASGVKRMPQAPTVTSQRLNCFPTCPRFTSRGRTDQHHQSTASLKSVLDSGGEDSVVGSGNIGRQQTIPCPSAAIVV
jgi:hypothetical protein